MPSTNGIASAARDTATSLSGPATLLGAAADCRLTKWTSRFDARAAVTTASTFHPFSQGSRQWVNAWSGQRRNKRFAAIGTGAWRRAAAPT